MVSLPYVSSPGNISKALNGIKSAAVPERVNQDFVKTILKIPGGSGDQMTAYLKKIGLTSSDGTPTQIYTRFRNPTSSRSAIAEAIRVGYKPLFARNEYMYELSDRDLLGLIVEETGQPHDAGPVKLTHSAIKSLKDFADFSSSHSTISPVPVAPTSPVKGDDGPKVTAPSTGNVGLNLGYTININLPATPDQAVFNAIFRSIKQNLLSEDDA